MKVEVLDAVRAADNPVVVFDVDSTLLSTAPRHLAILKAFAAERDHLALQELADTLTPADFGWTVDAPVRRRLALPEELYTELERYWFEGFFSSRFLHLDVPVPGALAFIEQVRRAGAWVYFLTARSAPEMAAGTLARLQQLGFPLVTGRSTLHLKPAHDIPDKVFKTMALDDIARVGQVVATFENEPANANLFQARFPEAVHVLLDTVCSPDAPALHPAVRRVADFR